MEHLAVLQGCVEFAYLDVGAVRHPDLLEAPEGLADGALVVVGEGGTGVAKVVRDADCQGQSGRKCECHEHVEFWLEARRAIFKIMGQGAYLHPLAPEVNVHQETPETCTRGVSGEIIF